MCGIAGLARWSAESGEQGRTVAAMCERIAHRGPDGGGVVVHREATLGMKRLAIVDIDGGCQPMRNDDESIVIVYNGEVYNAPAIRARLQKEGVRFRTRSDTEVVLRLYERAPERIEEELVGMWAFAIHDRRRRRLLLSRDRFGIKPLFLCDAGGGIAFASELTCFTPLGDSHGGGFALDPDAAHAMLAWSYVPEVSTIYRGVRRLAPATRLEVDLETGEKTERTYWHLRPDADAARVTSIDEAADYVEPILARSVKEHLESDVPIAAFLSGGIDSQLIAAYATRATSRTITAYTIGFSDPRFDETSRARAAATALGLRHEIRVLDETTARASVADALLAYDEPFGDSSAVATYLLARTVAAEHKVALSGDGGDEGFAGYRKHAVLRVRSALGHAAPLAARALAAIPARIDRTSRVADALRSAARLARGLAGTDAESQVAMTQVAPLARVLPLLRTPTDGARFVAPGVARFAAAAGDTLQKTLACDLASHLANDMLTKVDRATMAVSLEARVPMLDHRVVEAGVGLPGAFTLGGAGGPAGKVVLRALHARRFGPALANGKKQGFCVPVETWLRGTLAGACDELFATRRLDRFGLLSADALGDGRWRAWAARDPQVLWHAFALAVFCEARHGEGPDAVRALLG
jgi:asparagine synthase (glutamine-hydrolysing)